MAWEKAKSRPYMVDITISEHSQDKIRELEFFCKFFALLCFELLAFENP
jgi:hypothetical protein